MRLLLLCAAALPLGACHASWEKEGKSGPPSEYSGPAVSRSYTAANFTGVDVTGVDDVVIKYGDAFSVTASAPAKLLDELEIGVSGTTLKIGRKHHDGWNWGGSHGSAKISVTLPKLTAITITGTGDVEADKAEGDFVGSITGTGNIRLGALAGGNVKLSTAGPGDMTISGTANAIDVDLTGPGDIDVRGLAASGAKINVTGPGSVRGTVKGAADIMIMGPGDVDLVGGAQCKINKMGPGEAHCS